ncbi:MAG TPA: AraC family transcriptional regulator [Pelobium sp.]|nr:AraC family transcriptional regulator [Pelobium sp.]
MMTKNPIRNFFSLLNIDLVKLDNRWDFSNVISPYFRLYYIDGGEGTITTAKGLTELKAGFIYLIPSFTLCDLKCNSFLSQYFIQFFEESPDGLSLFAQSRMVMQKQATPYDIENFLRLLEINPGRGINRSDDPKVYEKDIYYQEYQNLNELQSISVRYETQGILFQLISGFLSQPGFKNNRIEIIPSTIIETINEIQINLGQALSVNKLASRVNLSPDYFSRLFYKHTGKRPIKYIQEKRIERAQYLITTTNSQYGEIANDVGFESFQYFARTFKKTTGLTPGEYKKQSQKMNFSDL